jgi:D-glycero-D-manno-heptose 1,7-bisphosphate phosphatase
MYSAEVIPQAIGLCGAWEIVNRDTKNHSKHLFLDRDGVIIQDYGYVNSLDKTEIIEPIVEVMRLAASVDIPITIITNQAGVAHGFFTEFEMVEYNLQLLNLLAKEHHVVVNSLHYCPSHPTAEVIRYKSICGCRKPMTGLFERASELYSVDLAESFFVGDKPSDQAAGIKLKMRYLNYNDHSDLRYLEEWLCGEAQG